MTRRNRGSTEPPSIFAKRAEFDLAVAEHIGIRCAPRPAFCKKVLEHALAVLVAETHAMQSQPELTGDLACILEVCRRFAMSVVLPIGHVQALDLVTGIAQHQRSDGRVDATG